MNEPTAAARVTRKLVLIQSLYGLCAYSLLGLPYLRRIHFAQHLDSSKRYLFAANHVSLLDSILLGGIVWRFGCYPILVLGDRNIWHASWIRRLLSGPIGFLLERGKLNPNRIRELQAYGRSGSDFHLVVFPEGTRGDGLNVGPCQPGLYFIAQEARLPIVPVFFENMHLVSTKTGRFHPIGGLRKVEVHFGKPIAPENYLDLSREDFTGFVRQHISALRPTQPAAHWSPVPRQV